MPRLAVTILLLLTAPPCLVLADNSDQEDLAALKRSMSVMHGPLAPWQLFRLDEIQKQAQQLARSTDDVREQFEAAQIRMQANYLLGDHNRNEQQLRLASMRMSEVRSDAWRLTQSKTQEHQVVGEYWLMQTDLAEINRIVPTVEDRQEKTIERMERFIHRQVRYGERLAPEAVAAVQHARLGLLPLYDQRGMSTKLCETVSLLKQLHARDRTLVSLLDEKYAYCDLLGQTIDVQMDLIDGRRWSMKDHRGKVVVLHFWAGPGNDVNDSKLTRLLANEKVSVLLVDLSYAYETGLSLPASRWPTYRPMAGGPDLTGLFDVRELPRFILIDAQGKIDSIGGPGISNRLAELISRANAPAISSRDEE